MGAAISPGPDGSDDGRPGPSRLPSITRTSDGSFQTMVAESVRAVESGEVAKVVVARHVDVRMGEPIDLVALLRRWHRMEPTCSVFSMPTPDGHLVGASPELLVERSGLGVRSRPLAGTTDRAGGTGASSRELLASTKDSAEHRMVVEAIAGALAPLCSELDVPAHPDLVHLHNITHLGTSVAGTLAPDPTVRPPPRWPWWPPCTRLRRWAACPAQRPWTSSPVEPRPGGLRRRRSGYVDGRGGRPSG